MPAPEIPVVTPAPPPSVDPRDPPELLDPEVPEIFSAELPDAPVPPLSLVPVEVAVPVDAFAGPDCLALFAPEAPVAPDGLCAIATLEPNADKKSIAKSLFIAMPPIRVKPHSSKSNAFIK
jgi:hypothetical protein